MIILPFQLNLITLILINNPNSKKNLSNIPFLYYKYKKELEEYLIDPFHKMN